MTDPLTELSKLAGQVITSKGMLAAKVSELTVMRFTPRALSSLRSEIAVFERALDRCNSVLPTITKLNIDELLGRVTRQPAAVLITAVDAALPEMGITPPERRPDARRAIVKRLRVFCRPLIGRALLCHHRLVGIRRSAAWTRPGGTVSCCRTSVATA